VGTTELIPAAALELRFYGSITKTKAKTYKRIYRDKGPNIGPKGMEGIKPGDGGGSGLEK
jgi:hypothetical protein